MHRSLDTTMYHRIGEQGGRYWGKSGAGILFTDGNSVLLLKRAPGTDNPHTWGLPGGKAESNETPMANAQREVKEETGLASIPGRRVEDFPQQDGHHRWTTYLYRVDKPFRVPRLSKEHEGWSWIKLDQLSKTNLHPKLKKQVAEYVRAIRRRITVKRSFAEWMALTDALRLLED